MHAAPTSGSSSSFRETVGTPFGPPFGLGSSYATNLGPSSTPFGVPRPLMTPYTPRSRPAPRLIGRPVCFTYTYMSIDLEFMYSRYLCMF